MTTEFERLLQIAKPILFQTDFIPAIREERKTQTCRVITRNNSNLNGYGIAPKEYWGELDFSNITVDPGPSPAGNPGDYLKVPHPPTQTRQRVYSKWQPGDYLYIKETVFYEWPTEEPAEIKDCRIVYRADEPNYIDSDMREYDSEMYRWRPSIFMHKIAARTIIKIKSVYPKHLLNVGTEEVLAEGAPPDLDQYELARWWIKTWDTINEKRGFAIDTNPLVWVLKFSIAAEKQI